MIEKIKIKDSVSNEGIVYYEKPDFKFLDRFELPDDVIGFSCWLRDEFSSPTGYAEWMIDINHQDINNPLMYGLKLPGNMSEAEIDCFIEGVKEEVNRLTYIQDENSAVFYEKLFSLDELITALDLSEQEIGFIYKIGYREKMDKDGDKAFSRFSVYYQTGPKFSFACKRFFFPDTVKFQELKHLSEQYRDNIW